MGIRPLGLMLLGGKSQIGKGVLGLLCEERKEEKNKKRKGTNHYGFVWMAMFLRILGS